MAALRPASQVSPFAAMTLGEQNTRWLSLHSQLMPYMTAVPAKAPPKATTPAGTTSPSAAWRAGAPAPAQVPIFNSPPQPTMHDQYDAVHKRMHEAQKQALNWVDVNREN